MASRLLRVLYHYAVYAIGIVVLLAAVVVSAVRLVFPDIGIYRTEVQAWISHYMGFPVVIRSLDASWSGWTPQLYLTNIDLLNKAGTAPITHFDSASISIDPLATLYQRRFVPKQLTVSGFQLSVARLASGAIHIQGAEESESAAPGATGRNELAEWLFLQRTIRMEKATVEWSDEMYRQSPILLSGVSLTLRSDGERLQIEGSAGLPPAYGERMDLAFDATGDLLSSGWSGELYLHADNVNPDNWYRNYRPVNVNIAGGNADIKAWSKWTEAKLVRIEGDLQYQDFAAQIGGTTLRVDQLGYRFVGERTETGGWRLDMHVADLATEHGNWPEANIRIHADPLPGRKEQRYAVRFDYLKLDDVAPLVSRLNFIPETARDKIVSMKVAGALHDGRLVFDPAATGSERIYFDSRFDGLETRFKESLPGLRGASGHLVGSLEEGRITFDDDQFDLLFPDGPVHGLRMQEVDGDLHWRRNAGGWLAEAEQLAFRLRDFDAVLSGSVSMEPEWNSPLVDLRVAVGPGDLEALAAELPRTENFRLGEWMERTVAAGNLVSATAALRGRLADFPFDEGQGRFQAIFNVEDVVYDYAPNWPPVDGLNAELQLDGHTLHGRINSGRIFNAEVEHATSRIENVFRNEKLVNLEGSIRGSVEDLRLFVSNSPLQADAILSQARDALVDGQMKMDLDMTIPVHMPERQAQVSGTLSLADARLHALDGKVILEEINGAFDFARDFASGSGIAARWNGKPVEMAITGTKGDAADPPAVILRGTAGPDFIAARLSEYFPRTAPTFDALARRLSGEADWELKVDFLPGTDGRSIDRTLHISSNLRGMDIDLPHPVGKDAAGEIPLEITRPASGAEYLIRYGSVLSSSLAPDAGGESLQATAIRFGETESVHATEPGVHVSGKVDRLDTAEWWTLLNQHGMATTAEPRPMSADLHVDELRLVNRDFADVQLNVTREPGGWEVRAAGPELTGEMLLPVNGDRSVPVRLNLDHIHLRKADDEADAPRPVDPGLLPALDIRTRSFDYGDIEFGALTLTASPIADGISIDRFEIAKPDLNISGSGQWIRQDDTDQSRFTIALRADRIDSMLQTFGYNVTSIRKGETTLDIDAAWTGAPSEFALAKLNGSLDMRVSKGQLLDVDPKAGRLFGLLSIQTLPRRLMLDFSDLFGKGLAFDAIEGSFQIEDGNAYTNDLYMEGPSASVTVTGRTGLADQDYDQIVTVMPRVAGTLPVAGALFGPVGIGVGAVLYLAGRVFDNVNDGFDSLLRYQYTVTGSWDDPVIEKLESQPEASG